MDASDQKLRRLGIGGSDAAAILGLSGYGSAYSVAVEKLAGIRVEPSEEQREWLDLGKRMEPLLRRLFEERTGMLVYPGEPFVAHQKHAFIFANADGLLADGMEPAGNGPAVSDGPDTGRVRSDFWSPAVPPELAELGPGIFEGKTAGGFDAAPWGNAREPKLPTSYWVQAQHYMAVLDRRWTGFGVLLNGNRFETRFVVRDDPWIAGTWEPGLVKFWADLQANIIPDPWDPDIDEPVLKARYANGDAGELQLTEEQTRIVYAWARAREEKGRAERQDKALTVSVRAMMGNYSIGRLTTGEQITYKLTEAGHRTLLTPHKPKARRR